MPPTEVPIVVVGAGAAGLAAAAMLERRGHDVVVLEADERIGGTWARRYDRLHLHTVRRFSGLPGRTLRRGLPKYVSKDDYAEYLAEYAAAHSLDVQLGTRVDSILPADGRWLVRAGGTDLSTRAVVVATGKHNRKRLPRWPGLEEFGGEFIHSADYAPAGSMRAGVRSSSVSGTAARRSRLTSWKSRLHSWRSLSERRRRLRSATSSASRCSFSEWC